MLRVKHFADLSIVFVFRRVCDGYYLIRRCLFTWMIGQPCMAELSMQIWLSTWISVRICLKLGMSVPNYPYNHGYKLRARIFVTLISKRTSVRISVLRIQDCSLLCIRDCTDKLTQTSVTIWISKRTSARTVRPGRLAASCCPLVLRLSAPRFINLLNFVHRLHSHKISLILLNI